MEYCKQCGKVLTKDEVALHKKLINRGADSYLCLPCLAKYFKVDETLLHEKIDYFKRFGCTLFQ